MKEKINLPKCICCQKPKYFLSDQNLCLPCVMIRPEKASKTLEQFEREVRSDIAKMFNLEL